MTIEKMQHTINQLEKELKVTNELLEKARVIINAAGINKQHEFYGKFYDKIVKHLEKISNYEVIH